MVSTQESRNYKRKKNIKSDDTKMLSVNHVAEKYGFSLHTVYNWIKRDGLKHVRHGPGKKILIKQADVEAFIDTWYPEPGIIGMAFPCKWLGCEEHVFIDYTVNGRPDYLPDGWQRLIISKNLMADKILSTPHISGYLCPKHYEELLGLLKKHESEEPDKDMAPGKGSENEERHDINVNTDSP